MGDKKIIKTKKKDMTIKQRRWLKEYLDCGNATQAAMKVYDCKDIESAGSVGWENLQKLDFKEFLERGGVTDHKLLNKILDGLEATRTVSAIKTSKQATADSTDFIDVPDFSVRHKYLETSLKLKNRLNDQSSGGNTNVTFNIIAGGYVPRQRSANEASMGSDDESVPVQDASMA